MKCKNCGGDYRTRELICPYCGTENLVGRIWMAQKTQAELEYEAYRKQAGTRVSPYVVNRVLGRIAVLLIGVCILVFIGALVVVLGADALRHYKIGHIGAEEQQQTMETLYQEGRLPELYQYMHENELIGQDQYVYSQAVLLNFDYENYRNHLLQFLELSEERKQEDDYYLSICIRWGNDVYQCRLGTYCELADENRPLYQSYCEDIKNTFIYTLGMTPDEADRILGMDTTDYQNYDDLARTLLERGKYVHGEE